MPSRSVPVVYELITVVGAGAFADVHRGRRQDTGSVYAVKVLREAWDPLARWRFVEEARRQLRVQGDHVVRIVDWNLEAPQPFVVQEFMPEGSLEKRLDRERQAGQRSWRACCALRALTEVADALTEVHARGYAHLDVKPGNLLFDSQTGKLKLSDFGCAATVVRTQLVSCGFCGTPAYAAPEHATAPGPKSDVYALGVMLYELLIGTRLPPQWWTQQVVWPSQMHSCGLGADVDTLIQWLAHPMPHYRPSSQDAARLLNAAWLRYRQQRAA